MINKSKQFKLRICFNTGTFLFKAPCIFKTTELKLIIDTYYKNCISKMLPEIIKIKYKKTENTIEIYFIPNV